MKASVIQDLRDQKAVFYCLTVGTFMDADGDGIDTGAPMERFDQLRRRDSPRSARSPG